MSDDPRSELLRAAADDEGDIAAGALWLAAEDCAGVKVREALGVLDEIGAELWTRLGKGRTPSPDAGIAHVLASVLRDRLGLRGGPGDDPRHHYLHSVIDSGVGIPIACGALYVAVGRRAGLPVVGIGLPGHFVVRVGGTLVDAHGDGEILDDAGARSLVSLALGRMPPALEEEWLRPATPRQMLARMSRNLRACHLAGGRHGLALRAADRCVALLPHDPGERRDRGLLRLRLGMTWPALRDLRAYLDGAPDAADRADIERIVAQARAVLN